MVEILIASEASELLIWNMCANGVVNLKGLVAV